MSTRGALALSCPSCGEACGCGDRTCRSLSLSRRRSSEGLTSPYVLPSGLPSPVRLQLLDALSLAGRPIQKLLLQRDPPAALAPVLRLAVTPEPPQVLEAPLRAPWLGRLALEARLQQLALELQGRVWLRLDALQDELRTRSEEVRRAQSDGERMRREKSEAEQRAQELERQVDVSVEMLAGLRHELSERDEQLRRKQQEVCELDRFVRDTAFREASAKIRLQHFIEDLLERAETAETQLQSIHCDITSSHRPQAGSRAQGYQRSYSVSGMSRRPSHLTDHRAAHIYRCEGRPRTLSVGSCGCEGPWDGRRYLCYGGAEGPDSRAQSPWRSQHTHTHTDESDHWSSYSSTESPDDTHTGYRTYSGRDESSVCSERLRLTAALFCVFIYLDTHALLTTAQVCKDWKSVARHPAVWTRVTLENTRISSKFLVTLSQWCCQTQSLVLHNLKPRARGKKENKDEYQRSTRGGLEAGLEAVLKAAGRSLVSLSVSHCSSILTDRTLWLVSCYCRSLQALTYRSSSDPVGQEVIWALGAGCRDITTLRIAPLQPCLQPQRFSNRCLQTIGRCWPNLCRVGVGGAGCGLQGLASLARNCVNLCELELDHMNELNQEGAAEICRDGLQQLHTLTFISTPVTARAILHFSSVCASLKRVVVQLSIADYFEDTDNEEAKRLFEEIVNNLQVLRKRPGLSDVLQIRVDKP